MPIAFPSQPSPSLERQNAQPRSANRAAQPSSAVASTNSLINTEPIGPDSFQTNDSPPSPAPKTRRSKFLVRFLAFSFPLIPKSALRFCETQLLFQGAQDSPNQNAPNLDKVKQKTRIGEMAYERTLIQQIQEVHFNAGQGDQRIRHRGWLLPPKKDKPTLLVSGPNMGRLTQILELLPFALGGYGLFIYEYPGYGKTKGKPTEAGLYRAVDAASDYLRDKQNIPTQRQIAYGVSLGGAVTAHLAANRDLKAVILESTFSSFPEVVQYTLGGPKAVGKKRFAKRLTHQFDSLSKANHFKSPLLILHANQDPLLPAQLAHRLYQQATSPQKSIQFLESNQHILPSEQSNEAIWGFLEQLDYRHQASHQD